MIRSYIVRRITSKPASIVTANPILLAFARAVLGREFAK
jgi:hypothetical protein